MADVIHHLSHYAGMARDDFSRDMIHSAIATLQSLPHISHECNHDGDLLHCFRCGAIRADLREPCPHRKATTP